MTYEEQTIDRIDSLIDDFDVAMLVTTSLDNELRGRPMAVAGHEEGNVLYFLTRSDDEKLQEILHESRVNVVMQGDSQYLSISGSAHLETDRVLIDRYWSAAARIWFPDGSDDPAATLVVVEPTYAEAWDSTGLNRLEFLWEAGKAILTGSKAAAKPLSGHDKVEH